MVAPESDYGERGRSRLRGRGKSRGQGGQDITPDPDPTRLTTQLVDRALASFREVVDARFAALDKATVLNASDVARVSTVVEAQTAHLRSDVDQHLLSLRELLLERIAHTADVMAEKFSGIDTRFLERDERTAQAAQESRISLDAALAAAKEAVSEQNKANTLAIGKSEGATQKQIDSNAVNAATEIRALEDKISDMKERLDRAEGRIAGELSARTQVHEVATDRRGGQSNLIAAVSAGIAFLAIVALVILSIVK